MDTQVNFRTNKKTLLKADKIFQEMGMDRSTALNMFLARVGAEEGLPFRPMINPLMLKDKWDKEVILARKTKGYKTARGATRSVLG